MKTEIKKGKRPQLLEKISSGISGLDEITEGGLPKGRPTLVCGNAGCGKTLLAMEFLVRGAVEHNEPGVFMAFEENEEELTRNVASLGFDLKALKSNPSEATFRVNSSSFSSKAMKTPGSLCSTAPRTKNSMARRVLPQPALPQTRDARPLGNPPSVISSSPEMPLEIVSNSCGLFPFLISVFIVKFFRWNPHYSLKSRTSPNGFALDSPCIHPNGNPEAQIIPRIPDAIRGCPGANAEVEPTSGRGAGPSPPFTLPDRDWPVRAGASRLFCSSPPRADSFFRRAIWPGPVRAHRVALAPGRTTSFLRRCESNETDARENHQGQHCRWPASWHGCRETNRPAYPGRRRCHQSTRVRWRGALPVCKTRLLETRRSKIPRAGKPARPCRDRPGDPAGSGKNIFRTGRNFVPSRCGWRQL